MFTLLSQDEQDDLVMSFMLAQERDQFAHELNQARYDAMLATIPDGAWKQRIKELRDQTAARLEEVNSIVEATKPQLPPQARRGAAMRRLKEKEKVRG